MRNPALNLPMMATVSDIPDWTVIESHGLGTFDFNDCQQPTAAQLQRMYEVSPSSLVGDNGAAAGAGCNRECGILRLRID